MSQNNFVRDVRRDALNMMEEFLDATIEQLLDDGKASGDLLNDYPNGDAYHHETHVDKDYSLSEAAELLDCLSDHEETDSGLWQGLEPREAIACQAAFTYGNAVMDHWQNLIENVNDDEELSLLLEDYGGIEDDVQNELTVLEEEHRHEQAEAKTEWELEQSAFPEEEREDFEGTDFDPPFDESEEVEKRQAEQAALIHTRVKAMILERRVEMIMEESEVGLPHDKRSLMAEPLIMADWLEENGAPTTAVRLRNVCR